MIYGVTFECTPKAGFHVGVWDLTDQDRLALLGITCPKWVDDHFEWSLGWPLVTQEEKVASAILTHLLRDNTRYVMEYVHDANRGVVEYSEEHLPALDGYTIELINVDICLRTNCSCYQSLRGLGIVRG